MIPSDDGVVLRCGGIAKRFGATTVLDNFGLSVEAGELLALLGPSGCGKTTALRVIAGFETPDVGEVWLGQRRVAGMGAWIPPERRRIGMVFQEWALFPHLDVRHNVAFGLSGRADRRVADVLDMVDLADFASRMPHELSGGQQQRVAIARALAPEPDLILLDEPFSNLDASLRAAVRSDVRDVLRAAGATAVFVTHDQEEALAMADRLAVMDRGHVLQVGRPHEVYRAPATRRVAAMVGEANFLSGRVSSEVAATPLGAVSAPGVDDGPVEVMVRPETIRLERDAGGDAVIVDAEFYGHDQLVWARVAGGQPIRVRLLGPRPDLSIGTRASVGLTAPAHFFRGGDAAPASPPRRLVADDRWGASSGGRSRA